MVVPRNDHRERFDFVFRQYLYIFYVILKSIIV